MAVIAQPSLRPGAKTINSTPTFHKPTARPPAVKRHSTLKRSVDETDLMSVPSSPSKRSRVAFDTDVDIVSADDEDDLDPLLVKEQVRRAVERHLAYDHESYENLRALFTAAPDKENAPATKVLKVHLQALLSNVSRLGRECSTLINSILYSEWIGRDSNYIALFVRFLGHLAAAQGGYVNRIMGMLVELLGPQKTRRLPDTKVVRAPKIHRRTLESIRFITQLVPTASGALADRISSKLGFEFQKADDRMTYVTNFMDLIQYVPELKTDILTNILRQLIKLDAAIQADLDDDDEAEDEILHHMTSSQTLAYAQSQNVRRNNYSDEDDDMSSSDDSDSDDETDLDPVALRRKKLREDVKQVDMIMDILFQYYAERNSSLNLHTQDDASEELIDLFNSLILPTHRSRHPQFLVFHFAQTDPVKVDRFLANCIGILLDSARPPVVRHSAAAYFAGFVGRGANVSPSLVVDCARLLKEQLNILRAKYEPQCRGPDVKRYGDFYSIFQAVMYIVCFRWRDLNENISDNEGNESDSDNDELHDYRLNSELQQALYAAIYSPLNPLRVCTPAIVEQFAKITLALQVFYIYPKIEENKRVRVVTYWRSVSDIDINQPDRDTSWLGDNGMLEGYFPYDPYHLPISKHWIEGDYLEWKGIPGEQAEDSDSDVDIDDYDTLQEIEVEALDSGEE